MSVSLWTRLSTTTCMIYACASVEHNRVRVFAVDAEIVVCGSFVSHTHMQSVGPEYGHRVCTARLLVSHSRSRPLHSFQFALNGLACVQFTPESKWRYKHANTQTRIYVCSSRCTFARYSIRKLIALMFLRSHHHYRCDCVCVPFTISSACRGVVVRNLRIHVIIIGA